MANEKLITQIQELINNNNQKAITGDSLANLLIDIVTELEVSEGGNSNGDGLLRVIVPFLELGELFYETGFNLDAWQAEQSIKILYPEFHSLVLDWIKRAMEHNAKVYSVLASKLERNEASAVILDYGESFMNSWNFGQEQEGEELLTNLAAGQIATVESISPNPSGGALGIGCCPIYDEHGSFGYPSTGYIEIKSDGSLTFSEELIAKNYGHYHIYLPQEGQILEAGELESNKQALYYLGWMYGATLGAVTILNRKSQYTDDVLVTWSYEITPTEYKFGNHDAEFRFFDGKVLKQAKFNVETGEVVITIVE